MVIKKLKLILIIWLFSTIYALFGIILERENIINNHEKIFNIISFIIFIIFVSIVTLFFIKYFKDYLSNRKQILFSTLLLSSLTSINIFFTRSIISFMYNGIGAIKESIDWFALFFIIEFLAIAITFFILFTLFQFTNKQKGKAL